MSEDIVREVFLFLEVMKSGIFLSAGYDIIQIIRCVIKCNRIRVAVQDVFFWTIASFYLFVLLYEETNGILRWYLIVGTMAGMLLYQVFIGNRVVKIMSTIILSGKKKIKKAAKIVFRPFYRAFSLLGSVVLKSNSFLKKRLTVCIKLVRIALCKHCKLRLQTEHNSHSRQSVLDRSIGSKEFEGRSKNGQKRRKETKAKMPDHEKKKS